MGGMPRLITPMMASLRRGLPHDDDRYGWEFKWDGVRAIAYISGGQIRLLSRTGQDMTGRYPELAVLAGRVDVPVIVDGEIIAIRHGRPDFGLLQSRMHVRHPPGHLVREVPVQLYLFDLLCFASAGCAATSTPATNARPDVGTTRVVKIPAVVVFPAPFGPSRPKISPTWTSRFSRSTAVKSAPA